MSDFVLTSRWLRVYHWRDLIMTAQRWRVGAWTEGANQAVPFKSWHLRITGAGHVWQVSIGRRV